MSYRCKVCRDTVPHNKQRLVHIIKRPDGQIAREVPVCERCHDLLTRGISVSDMPTVESATPVVKNQLQGAAGRTKLVPTQEQ